MKNFSRILKWLFLISIIALIVHLCLEPLFIPKALHTSSKHAYFPKYIAHKALISQDIKKDMLFAIQKAVASYVNGIEIDIKFSKDNIPFVYKDYESNNIINGKKNHDNYIWDDLKKINSSGRINILSLEEIFKLVGSFKYILINIRSNDLFNKDKSESIIGLIKRYHLQDTVIVESFNPFFLMSMRRRSNDIMLMYNFTRDLKVNNEHTSLLIENIPWLFRQSFFQKQVRRIIRPDLLGLWWNFNENNIKYFVSHKYPIIYSTVDSVGEANALFKLGVKGVKTNNALQLIRSTNLVGQKIYDAGGSKSDIYQLIHVKSIEDIVNIILKARSIGKQISIAGRRHSMGGQALLDNSFHLSMLRIDHVHYNDNSHIITVGAGATWKKIQNILDQHGRSVKVMQSDNIFTVGGSISANVHGWHTGSPPIISTIVSIKIVTANGKITKVSQELNPKLFRAIVGGYGQFGVIYEAELMTVANSEVSFQARFVDRHMLKYTWDEYITSNSKVELAYSRLSVDQKNIFKEAGIFYFERKNVLSLEQIHPESLISLKRAVFRVSEYSELGKKLRWKAEKTYAKKMMNANTISRNNAMNADIHVLWPLYGTNKDILHEYFIPQSKIDTFLDAFKKIIIKFKMNILNVTIREVKKDTISLLPYAVSDMFGVVCLFSQKQGNKSELRMKNFTTEVIDVVNSLQGTFYLPYRLHYNKKQLEGAYPNIENWFRTKNDLDPRNIFNSQFFEHIKNLVENGV